MQYVYLLQSIHHPDKRYIGLTSDVEERLKAHNAGKSPHTAKHVPWKFIAAIHFEDGTKPVAFERYLKSGSGRAFARRHFW